MRSYVRAAALIAAAAPAIALAAPASAQSPAGVWETEVPTRVEVQNGEPVGSNPVKVMIKLEQKGDSVIGTWERGPMEGLPSAPVRKLKGVLKGTQLTLQSEPTTAKIQRGDDDPYEVQMVTTYVLTVTADELKGTESSMSTDGGIQSPERAFSAKRQHAHGSAG